MYSFNYVKPESVAAAAEAIKAGAQALGGGQTLIPTMKQRLADPGTLVDLTALAEIKGICMTDAGHVSVGGATRHADVAGNADMLAKIPALAALAGQIGDPQVRNRGTIGGSLANNDPAACYPAAVLGLGARVRTSARQIEADDYFQGMFTTALEEGEIITAVDFPVPEKASYQKFIQPASRFALTAAFVAKFADGVRVAITGASQDGVFRWAEAEAALASGFSPDAVDALTVNPEGMIGDLHGSPEYRAHLVKVMTKRAVAAAG